MKKWVMCFIKSTNLIKRYIKRTLICCVITAFCYCYPFYAGAYAAVSESQPNNNEEVATEVYMYAPQTQTEQVMQAINKWEITESFQYQRGKFGTDDVTKIYEYDTAIERFFQKGDITITIPYLKQRAPNSVILVDGHTLNESLGTEKRVSDGIGDVSLDATYYVLSESNKSPLDVNLYGHVKFPTASKRKGLGTHEFDGGPGLGLSKRFLSKWRAFSDFYFTYIGNISGTYFQNELQFDHGIEYQFTPKFSSSISYEYSNALLKLTPDPRDIALSMNYKYNDKLRIFGKYAFGLSNGSPTQLIQIGIGVGF